MAVDTIFATICYRDDYSVFLQIGMHYSYDLTIFNINTTNDLGSFKLHIVRVQLPVRAKLSHFMLSPS